MSETTMLHVRMDGKTKKGAEAVFAKLGISTSDAIRIFFKQVKLQKGLPFEVRIPNAESRKAVEEVRQGKVQAFKNFEEFQRSIKGDA